MTAQYTAYKYIPFDKSWIIRMGVLDLVNGYTDIDEFLADHESELGTDLAALQRSLQDWRAGRPIRVGESGTLFRFLRFTSWALGRADTFVCERTLKDRVITDDPAIVRWSLQDLLKLDNGTSQWASAAVLNGSDEEVADPPPKLALTYEATAHWRQRRSEGCLWEPRYDHTIQRQYETFQELCRGNAPVFEPAHSEDYCFACAFGYMSRTEGERRWPSLRGHETDRIREMEEQLSRYNEGQPITSRDHRVIQSIVMLATVNGDRCEVSYPDAVSKSWPQFWRAIE